ncbi:Leucine rich repeat 4 [Corchorus capsularis]|uniref:Leucine rich repeat 4 n=1 Tax=Corchorus capsularis TaxID=210143 RepID=A0A1R3ISM1_COCAP|nr:Leucine rich repeat 4 [Corchorus capsularis]
MENCKKKERKKPPIAYAGSLAKFEAAYNQIEGSMDPGIGNLMMLQLLDLRGNRLSGSLPDQLGELKNLTWILLGGNKLTGEIPSQLGQLASLKLLIKEGRPSELFSAELWETGPKENLLGMLRLASACTAETLSVRPTMKQVLEKLKQLKS